MSLNTPSGVRHLQGHEERMIRYFTPRLVKTLRSQHFAESNNIHYEGPTIEGIGEFHDLSIPYKLVALHLATDHLMDRYHDHQQYRWLNGALECLYSWMIYDISQELITGDIASRTIVTKAYQYAFQNDGSGIRILADHSSIAYWTDWVNKLASRTVYPPDAFTDPVIKLTMNEEATILACQYFDDGMPPSKPPFQE